MSMQVPGSGMREGEGTRTQAAGICKCQNLWGKNLNGEICMGSSMAVLAIGFLRGKSCWSPSKNSLLGSMMRFSVMMEHLQYLLRSSGVNAPLQSRPLGTTVISTMWLLLVAPAVLPHS